MAAQEGDFYQSLRKRIHDWLQTEEGRDYQWTKFLLAAPDFFHLLCKLAIDRDVPTAEKAKLAAAIAYFVSPIDLLPEAVLGPIGYVDDVAFAAYVLNSIVNVTNPEVVRRHWAGEDDVLEVIQSALKSADQMVGGGLWEKLKRLVK
jgi:uncharacterized membrane protein YkvA (DUF1232 family)